MIVWLASYPRSGNTFLRVILHSVFGIGTYSIYGDESDLASDKKTSDVVGHKFLPEDFDIEKVRAADELFIIKTHEYPLNEEDKVIYLLRDGRESTLSFLKHQNTFTTHTYQLRDVILGNTFIGSWGAHASVWSPKTRKDTLLIRFEDLVASPDRYIKTLADFLNIAPVGKTIPTFEELQNINPAFFRSGRVDSWKEEFSQEEHLSFWLKNYAPMLEYGYTDDIPALISETEDDLLLQLSEDNNYVHQVLIAGYRERLEARGGRINYLESKISKLVSKISKLENNIEKMKDKIREQRERIDGQKEEVIVLRQSNRQLFRELTLVKSSKSYKVARFLAKLSRKFKNNLPK